MCDKMKVLFFRCRNPSPTNISAIAKIILPDHDRNNDNIKFLRGWDLEYLAQHQSRLNNDLNYFADEYIKIHR